MRLIHYKFLVGPQQPSEVSEAATAARRPRPRPTPPPTPPPTQSSPAHPSPVHPSPAHPPPPPPSPVHPSPAHPPPPPPSPVHPSPAHPPPPPPSPVHPSPAHPPPPPPSPVHPSSAHPRSAHSRSAHPRSAQPRPGVRRSSEGETAARSTGKRWWLVALGAGAACAAGAAALPPAAASLAGHGIGIVAVLIAAVAVARRAADRLGWALILAGAALWTAGAIAGAAGIAGAASIAGAAGTTGAASIAGVASTTGTAGTVSTALGAIVLPVGVGYLLAPYPLFAAGLVRLSRSGGPVAPGLVVDAAVITGATAIGGWMLVVEPHARVPGASPLALGTALAYVVLDLLVVAAALRLVGFGGRPPPAHVILTAAVAALVGGDVLALLGAPVTLPWTVGLAAAALHPAGTRRPRGRSGPVAVSPRRLAVFAVLALVVPVAPALVPGAPAHRARPGAARRGGRRSCWWCGWRCWRRWSGARPRRWPTPGRSARRCATNSTHRANHDPLTGLASRASLTAHLTGPQRHGSLILIDLDGFAEINDAHGHQVGRRPADGGRRPAAGRDDRRPGAGPPRRRRVRRTAPRRRRSGGPAGAGRAAAGVPDRRTGTARHRERRAGAHPHRRPCRRGAARRRPGPRRGQDRGPGPAGACSVRSCARRCCAAARWPTASGTRSTVANWSSPTSRWSSWRRAGWWPPRRCCAGGDGGESVPPVQFVPLAEQTGLIVPIGWWALRQACEQAARWYPEHGVAVTVNVSAAPAARGRLRRAGARDTGEPRECRARR